MALEAEVINFTLNTSTGNQVVPTTVNPKAVIFFGTHQTAAGITNNAGDEQLWRGFTDGTNEVVSGNAEESTADDAAGWLRNDACVAIYDPTGGDPPTVLADASIVSLGTGQFTINVTTAPATGIVVQALVLGGSDISNVAVTSGQIAGTSASDTSVGFQGDVALMTGAPRLAAFGAQGHDHANGAPVMCAGIALSSTTRHSSGCRMRASNGVATIEKDSGFRSDAALAGTGGDGTWDDVWDFVGFTASGFDLTKDLDGGHDGYYGALVLAGSFQAHLDTITQPSATGTQDITGAGFQPVASLIWASADRPSGVAQDGRLVHGAATATDAEGLSGLWGQYNADNDGAALRTTRMIESLEVAGMTTVADAEFGQFLADGLQVNWLTADTTARDHGVLLLGSTSATGSVPDQPTAQTPLWIAGTNARLHSSAYSEPDGDAHQSTDWQVDVSGGDFSSPVYEALDSADLEEHTIPQDTLSRETDYIYRVRHTDTDGDSTWSAAQAFTTTGAAVSGFGGRGGV